MKTFDEWYEHVDEWSPAESALAGWNAALQEAHKMVLAAFKAEATKGDLAVVVLAELEEAQSD